MRMRKKKNLDTRLAACAAVMADNRLHTAARGAHCLATKTPCIWKLAAAGPLYH